jgi:carboxyl-terminal processing protease
LAVLLIDGMAVEKQNVQLVSFDQVWNTVRERHWDKQKVGAAWDKAREELRPLAIQARTADEVRPVIQKLLDRLGESHFHVIPAEAYQQMRASGDEGMAQPEFDFRVIDGEAIVTRAAGQVQGGWALRKIDERDLAALISKVEAAIPNDREARLVEYVLIQQCLGGQDGTTRNITFATGDGQLKRLAVPLSAQGHIVQYGNLPPIGMQIAWRRMGDCEYFRFNAFLEPEWLQKELRLAVESCSDCKGFILDLRGNLGGLVPLVTATAAWFEPEETTLGSMTSKMGKFKLIVFPRANGFRGKLAVLVDALSVSSAEFLAAGLKDLNRARVFGEVTQGAALPSVVEKLPNGDGFQFAIADYVSAAGAAVEGVGVTPHVIMRPNRNDYLAGHDPVLEAARQWINSKENQ